MENYSNIYVSLSLVIPMFVFHCLLQILQDYSSYDLTRPMPGLTDDQHRSVIHEGPLRLLEKQGKVRLSFAFSFKMKSAKFLSAVNSRGSSSLISFPM